MKKNQIYKLSFIPGAPDYGIFVSCLWTLSFCILITTVFTFITKKIHIPLKISKQYYSKILKNLIIKVNTKQTSTILIFLILIFLLVTIYSQKTILNLNAIFTNVKQVNETIIISKNPDFNYEREEWPHEWGARMDELPESFWEPWEGKFFYLKEAAGRKGVIVIHPISENEPSFIEQKVSLPIGKFILRATIADIAYDIDKILGSHTDCSYTDVIFKIKIVYGNQEEIIWEAVKNSNEGWVEVVLDISKFANKDITMRIESYAGGLLPWCGEWAAVDKFYVIQAV